MAVVLLAPLLVALAGPASPAAAVTPEPIPGDLWDTNPAVGAGQSYVAFDGTPGDPVTGGLDYLFTQADSVIQVSAQSGGLITVNVNGDTKWGITLKAMSGVEPIAVGYYPGATRYPFNLATSPGLDWGSQFLGCNQLIGWFAVDSITIVSGVLTQLTARFSQSCDGAPASFGKVRWIAGDATTPASPGTIPQDLWNTDPAVGAGQSYVAIDSPAGDLLGTGLPELFTKATAVLGLTESGGKLSVNVAGDEAWTIDVVPMTSIPSVQTGYYPELLPISQINPTKGGLTVTRNLSFCSTARGWVAVDQLTRVNGVITALTLRFGTVCKPGDPELHGKVRWLATDPTPPAGVPTPIPGGLWDADPGVPAGQTYVVLSGDSGEVISGGGGGTFTRSNARVDVSESGGVINVQVDELSSWKGAFSTLGKSVPLGAGYYNPTSAMPTPNVVTGAMSWSRGPTTCAFSSGWFAVDQISRSAGTLTSATIRFGLTCDGVHTLNGKIRWFASDTTTPSPVSPVPAGLWDVTPQGVTGNYVFIDGVAGDQVTNGADVVLQDPQHPGIPADYQGGIASIIGSGNQQDFWLAEFDGVDDQGTVQLGYYPDLSSTTSPNPVLGGVRVTHFTQGGRSCTPGTTTGWFAVDHLGRIDGQIAKLDLRFEQSCNGAPPMHGRLHYDVGGLEVGPPIGELDTVTASAGGVDVTGWALDPETASPIGVKVLVDGVPTNATADQARPDIGATHVPYGDGHGFAVHVATGPGAHTVCVTAVNVEVGADTSLGCRQVQVRTGSPVGSLDSVTATPGKVSLYGWAIDPDVTGPAQVLLYLDGAALPLTADVSRPDVGTVFPGYGPLHGYAASLSTAAGAHRVCAYGLNVGVGSNSLLGCRDVVVPDGSPFGSLDAVTASPGKVSVSGWAIDPDAGGPAQVHLYLDGAAVALSAGASRPDVGSAFPSYGPDHGYTAVLGAAPGAHRVCAYGINAGSGHDVVLGCRDVTVPSGPPFGSLDVVTGATGSVRVQGWAIDPDTAGSIQVHVYVDGASVATTANMSRPDVGAAFSGYGAGHGYDVTLGATAGSHRVCAYAINVGAGTNSALGCRSVTAG